MRQRGGHAARAGRAPESRTAATALILANLNAHLPANRCPLRFQSRPESVFPGVPGKPANTISSTSDRRYFPSKS